MGISSAAVRRLSILFCLSFGIVVPFAQAQAQRTPATYEEKKRQANDIAVNIVVSGISCTCARFAEDIRNVVNDMRQDGLRVLPVLGIGGLQNLNDVLFLKNIDMGVVDEDNLRLLKRRDPVLYANIEQRVHYITKLYNSELHVLARSEIKSYDDLRGKKVNFNLKDSQTEVTAEIIFDMLKIDVQRTNYDNDEAVKKLRDGDIEAMIILTGAPQATLAKLKKEDGVHFLALDERSLPGHDVRAILGHYLPAELTSKQYPALIDEVTIVPTVANRALLVAYAWAPNSVRYNRIAKFVHEFFGRIDQFQNSARHPKWKDISIAAEIPGWTRFKPAADWLAQHRTIALNQSSPIGSSGDIKLAFDQFVENYTMSTGQRTFSADEREVLFTKFKQFIQSQTSTGSVR